MDGVNVSSVAAKAAAFTPLDIPAPRPSLARSLLLPASTRRGRHTLQPQNPANRIQSRKPH